MALLGTNVQCRDNFPGYYSTRGLIFDSEGNTWTSSNVNNELRTDGYHMSSLLVSSPCTLLGYDKELLKQTILKHEAVFRDQIRELHRVYHKQRELMEEIKWSELYKGNVRLEASLSSSSLSSKDAQKIYSSSNLPCSTARSCVIVAESFRFPQTFAQEKSKQMCPVGASTVTEESSKDYKLPESKCRKIGKKILDLQLPADEYIDSEEGEENGKVTEVQAPQVLLPYSLNRISQVVCNSHDKYENISRGFADLNIPFKLQEETAMKSYEMEAPTHHVNNSFYDMSMRTKYGSKYLPNSSGHSGGLLDYFAKVIHTEKHSVSVDSLSKNLEQFNDLQRFNLLHQINQGHWTERKLYIGESCGRTKSPISNGLLGENSVSRTYARHQLVSGADMINSEISPADLWKTPISDFGQSPPAVQLSSAALAQNSKLLMGISGFTRNEFYNATSVTSSPSLGTPKNLNLNFMPAGYSDSTAIQSIQITGEENKFGSSTMGLPCQELEKGCISDVKSPRIHVPDFGEQIPADEHLMKNQKKKHESLAGIIDLNSSIVEEENMPIEVDFHAPASLENKECPPPRGESDENQLLTPFQLAEQKDLAVQEEQTRLAAEALVSISGFVAQKDIQMTTCSSPEPLHWFAEIVSTTVEHPEKENKRHLNGKANDVEDYFELMTLNLTETKVLDCCYKSVSQTEQLGGSASPRKWGRTNRGRQRKDFQSEILPSVASLSRYEVTEDLQTIGSLITSGSLTSGSRSVLGRGRRRGGTTNSNISDLLLNLKQLTGITKLGIEKSGLKSWEKTSRKRRGQRIPTTNPQFIFNRVHN